MSLTTTLLGQHDRQLWAPDEMREAGISFSMARTGDFVTPRLNGRPFLEKPPLFHAVGAVIFSATGSRSPFVARLPAVLFALLTLAATYHLARRIGGVRLGLLSVLALSVSAGFFTGYHRAVTDNANPLFVTLAYVAFDRVRESRASWPAWLGLGLALAAAFLAKGAIGPALFLSGALFVVALDSDRRILRDPRMLLAAGGFLAPVVGWIVLLALNEGWSAARTFLVDNNWNRALDSSTDHAAPWWNYAEHLPTSLLPWTPLLVVAGAVALANRIKRLSVTGHGLDPGIRAWFSTEKQDGGMRLPMAWLLGGLLLLSIASAKRSIYLLPLLPAGAILAARVLEAVLFEDRFARFKRLLGGSLAVLASLALASAIVFDLATRGWKDSYLLPAGFAAVVGAALIPIGLRSNRTMWLISLCFFMLALVPLVFLRGTSLKEDAYRGSESFAAMVEQAAKGRDAILYRPSEAMRGAVAYYLDRDIPEVRDSLGLVAARSRCGTHGLLVIGDGDSDEVVAALGSGRLLAADPAHRDRWTLLLYEANEPR